MLVGHGVWVRSRLELWSVEGFLYGEKRKIRLACFCLAGAFTESLGELVEEGATK